MNILKIIKNLRGFRPHSKKPDAYQYVSGSIARSVRDNPEKSKVIGKFVKKVYTQHGDELSELSRN